MKTIPTLTGTDFQDLHILANKMNDDPEFWEYVKQISVTGRLSKKKSVAVKSDFSIFNSKEKIEAAIHSSMACEIAFNKDNKPHIANLFRGITDTLFELKTALN